jgi:stage II sporulation protein R
MEMLLLSEERECGKMKKKKSMFIILCMLTVLAVT